MKEKVKKLIDEDLEVGNLKFYFLCLNQIFGHSFGSSLLFWNDFSSSYQIFFPFLLVINERSW